MHEFSYALGRLAMLSVLVGSLAGCAAIFEPKPEAAAAKVEPLPGGLPAEPLGVNKELGPPSPHWVLYGVLMNAFEVNRHVLFDADAGEIRALVTTGMFPSLQASPDGRELYIADTFNHGPARLRKDYVSFYDARDYSLSDSIELPGRQRALFAPRAKSAVIAWISAASSRENSLSGIDVCIAISFIMSPCTRILPAMNDCIATVGS